MIVLRRLYEKYVNLPIIAKATLWFVFCSVIQKGMVFFTTPIFSRLMTTSQFGQYSIYGSWLQILSIITTFRLNGAVFNKGMSKYKNDRNSYTATMQTTTLIITFFVFILYLAFHSYINAIIDFPTFIMLAVFAELFVIPAIDFWTLRKRYEYQYMQVVYCTFLMALLNAAIGIIAVCLCKEKGYARILSSIFVNCCFGIALFYYNFHNSKTIFDKEQACFAISFNFPLLLHYFCQYVLDQFDRIMVQNLVSLSAAGIYSVAYSLGLGLRVVTTSINSAIVPWLYSRLEKKEFKRIDDTMLFVFSIVAVCSILLSSFAPELMKILADERYYEGVYVVPPVALGLFFSFMYTMFANVEFFYNKNKFSMYISCIGAFLNIILNYIGILKFGYIAAAYTTLICFVLFALAHYVYMTKSIQKSEGVKKLFSSQRLLVLSVIAILYGMFIITLYNNYIYRYLVIGTIVAMFYFKRDEVTSILKQIHQKN